MSHVVHTQVSTALNQITVGHEPITVEAGTKIPGKLWGTKLGDWMNEGVVYVRENELMCGVLDKNQFGASAYGLVHVSTPPFFFHFDY
jgi:DNA-directed RNA polymerase I subunit RPA1